MLSISSTCSGVILRLDAENQRLLAPCPSNTVFPISESKLSTLLNEKLVPKFSCCYLIYTHLHLPAIQHSVVLALQFLSSFSTLQGPYPQAHEPRSINSTCQSLQAVASLTGTFLLSTLFSGSRSKHLMNTKYVVLKCLQRKETHTDQHKKQT